MSRNAKRDWRLYADDIIEACVKIRRFIAGIDYDAFVADERTCDAVIRNLEIIGEAAKNLPDEETAKAPQIPAEFRCLHGGRAWTIRSFARSTSTVPASTSPRPKSAGPLQR